VDPSQRPTSWAGVLSVMALPLAVGLFTLVGSTFASRGQPLARPLDVLGYALLLVGPAALGLRRVQPVAGFAVAAAAVAVYLGAGYPFGPVFLAPVLALCFTITAGHRLAAYSIAGTGFAAILLIHIAAHPAARNGCGLPRNCTMCSATTSR
jgi:hypothetical protein